MPRTDHGGRRNRLARGTAWRIGLLLGAPLSLPAQSLIVTGRVLHRGDGERPLAGQWVALHEVRRDSGGPLDSVATDPLGRYRLRLRARHTTALYLVSTTFQDVRYFSAPLSLAAGNVEAEPVVVYDTTVGGPAMRLERRVLTLFRAGEGGRDVRELIEISNPGTHTRIAPDRLNPVWTLTLPPGAAAVEVGEGDIAPEAIWVERDTLKVFAPIWPGPPRRTLFRYRLSGATASIPLDQWTGVLGVLVEDTTAVLSGARLDTLGMHETEGRRFKVFSAGPLEAGSALSVTFSSGTLQAERLVPYIAGAAGLALAWGLVVALRRKPASAPSPRSAKRRAHR